MMVVNCIPSQRPEVFKRLSVEDGDSTAALFEREDFRFY